MRGPDQAARMDPDMTKAAPVERPSNDQRKATRSPNDLDNEPAQDLAIPERSGRSVVGDRAPFRCIALENYGGRSGMAVFQHSVELIPATPPR